MNQTRICQNCGCEFPKETRDPGPLLCPGCVLMGALEKGGFSGDDDEAPTRIDAAKPVPGRLKEGARVGRYRIVSFLASGGSGEIYLAEQQGDVALKVAVKIMRAAAESDRMVARFEAEREALMRMDHPGIAKVLDAGFLDDGRPYVSMEWVPGKNLDAYLDSEGARLTLDDRLSLFREICIAVQHAHQKGIVHRDLKPANILVSETDGIPRPKLIDFGIARALDRPESLEGAFTRHAEIVGTPVYMSPEQTLGGSADIDVRTDVYALGLVLYEILTGSPPIRPEDFESMSLDAVLQAIRDRQSPAPSAMTAGIDGDLDAITLKALAKEPSRRYQSALALAEDLERHANHEPVIATPPTTVYRLTKFVRRNRIGVTAATAVLASFVVGGIVSLYQANRARNAAELASHRLSASEELIEFMVSDLYKKLKPTGRLDAMGGTAEKVNQFYHKLGETNRSVDSVVKQGRSYMQLGRVRSALGDSEEAVSFFRAGIDILERQRRRKRDHEETIDTLTNAWTSLGTHHVRRSQFEEADAAFSKASRIAERQIKENPGSEVWINALLDILINQSTSFDRQGKYEEALRKLRRAEMLMSDKTATPTRVVILQNIGHNLIRLENYSEAEEVTKKAMDLQEKQVGKEPENTDLLSRFCEIMTNLGAALYFQEDRTRDLLELNRQIIARRKHLLRIEPDHVVWRDKLATTYTNYALALMSSGDTAGCIDAAGNSHNTRKPLVFPKLLDAGVRSSFLGNLSLFERVLASIGQWEKIFPELVESYPLLQNDNQRRDMALRIGRAASWISVGEEIDLQKEETSDYRMLSLWIVKHYHVSEAERKKLKWAPDFETGVASEIDTRQLAAAAAQGRLVLPKDWPDHFEGRNGK